MGNSSNGNPQNLSDRPLEDVRSSSVLTVLVVRQHTVGKGIPIFISVEAVLRFSLSD